MTVPTSAGPRTPRGGIVVGVDRLSGSLAALRGAIRTRRCAAGAVHAVTAWNVPMPTFGDMATLRRHGHRRRLPSGALEPRTPTSAGAS
jgi:hypothetical protein